MTRHASLVAPRSIARHAPPDASEARGIYDRHVRRSRGRVEVRRAVASCVDRRASRPCAAEAAAAQPECAPSGSDGPSARSRPREFRARRPAMLAAPARARRARPDGARAREAGAACESASCPAVTATGASAQERADGRRPAARWGLYQTLSSMSGRSSETARCAGVEVAWSFEAARQREVELTLRDTHRRRRVARRWRTRYSWL